MLPVALTDEAIQLVAPSVFATAAHSSRSPNFVHISTGTVLHAMREKGFEVVQAGQGKVRKDLTRADFTKHLLRLRHRDHLEGTVSRKNDVVPEIVLVNAADGTSRYYISGGLFRFVCSNGLVVADSLIAGLSVKHSGEAAKEVIDASFEVLNQTSKAVAVAQDWTTIHLTHLQQTAFADAARFLRYQSAKNTSLETIPFTAEQLLNPRRAEDLQDDLWHTFNRVQENAINGGFKALKKSSNQLVVSRPLRNIDSNLNFNKGLWSLAEQMAEAA